MKDASGSIETKLISKTVFLSHSIILSQNTEEFEKKIQQKTEKDNY